MIDLTTASTVLAGLTGLSSVGVWAVRLEGKVNTHTRLFEEREKLAETRHEDLANRLDRIEAKLDRSNGFSTHSG
jgi:hypothetical protein